MSEGQPSVVDHDFEVHCARIRLHLEEMVRAELEREGCVDAPLLRSHMRKWLSSLSHDSNQWELPQAPLPLQPAWIGVMRQLDQFDLLNLIIDTQRSIWCNERDLERERESVGAQIFPCREVRHVGTRKPKHNWPERWRKAGGILYGGRMIAPKDSPVWSNFGSSQLFSDGLDISMPPFCLGSDLIWSNLWRDECAYLGMSLPGRQFSAEELEAVAKRLAEDEERRAKAQRMYQANRLIDDYLGEEKDRTFRLLEKLEGSPIPANDPAGWKTWSDSLAVLTTTEHFENYPNWRARAWRLCAKMHEIVQDSAAERECLEAALTLNPKLPVKRRLKSLHKSLARSQGGALISQSPTS